MIISALLVTNVSVMNRLCHINYGVLKYLIYIYMIKNHTKYSRSHNWQMQTKHVQLNRT